MTEPLLGFLTITANPRYGFIGGYLVLNTAGRPVEFHCTTPVRATRAQEILYGTTLQPFLCGEQITTALIQRSKTVPSLFLTDIPVVLAAQKLIEVPISYIFARHVSTKFANTTNFTNTANFENHEKKHEIKVAQLSPEEEPTVSTDDSAEFWGESLFGVDLRNWKVTKIRHQQIAIPNLPKSPRIEIISRLDIFSAMFDLLEPFERIRLALEEAQRAA